MTEAEILDKLNAAVKALTEYKKLSESRPDPLRSSYIDEIEKVKKDLIFESYASLSSGKQCPRCKGTGKV